MQKMSRGSFSVFMGPALDGLEETFDEQSLQQLHVLPLDFHDSLSVRL